MEHSSEEDQYINELHADKNKCGNSGENGEPLRKHACSNILKISPPKNENFQIKNSNIFHISAQIIDCWYSLEPSRRGGSNEYPNL